MKFSTVNRLFYGLVSIAALSFAVTNAIAAIWRYTSTVVRDPTDLVFLSVLLTMSLLLCAIGIMGGRIAIEGEIE